MYQVMSCAVTPNSCCSAARVHSAAVCWYSGTPTRLPFRSAGSRIPALALTYMPVWKNRRVVKTGMAVHVRSPLASATSREDSDSSEMSNSPNFSCRQNISDACTAVEVRSTPSTVTVPSSSGRVIALGVSAALSDRLLNECSCLGQAGSVRRPCRA